MNFKQRQKIEVAIEVLLNGSSKINPYMERPDAYDILEEYVRIYDENKNENRRSKLGLSIEMNETEDTETLINICRVFVKSEKIKLWVYFDRKNDNEEDEDEESE